MHAREGAGGGSDEHEQDGNTRWSRGEPGTKSGDQPHWHRPHWRAWCRWIPNPLDCVDPNLKPGLANLDSKRRMGMIG
jgi:hypothetical protein